ncbi:hypothetical protein XH89_12505 [Bradyrhizobium sp. CCBAU 53340]|nr:hypothetical protein XH89_12505 [Bradyrhizobium sp. CCBAU 53340]
MRGMCSLSSSLQAQRSNPESLLGKTLDCFAVLAMTEYVVGSVPPLAHRACRESFAPTHPLAA